MILTTTILLLKSTPLCSVIYCIKHLFSSFLLCLTLFRDANKPIFCKSNKQSSLFSHNLVTGPISRKRRIPRYPWITRTLQNPLPIIDWSTVWMWNYLTRSEALQALEKFLTPFSESVSAQWINNSASQC